MSQISTLKKTNPEDTIKKIKQIDFLGLKKRAIKWAAKAKPYIPGIVLIMTIWLIYSWGASVMQARLTAEFESKLNYAKEIQRIQINGTTYLIQENR